MRRPPSSLQALTPFPSVEERVAESTEAWVRDLRDLFAHARQRFADVSWETDTTDRVWAHKAVVYVRATKEFKARYFLPNKTISRSPTSFSAQAPTPSPYPASSSASGSSSLHPPGYARRTPSPSFRGSSVSLSTAESDGTLRAPSLTGGGDGVLRLGHGDAPEVFRAQLEWLYTAEGVGDVIGMMGKDSAAAGGTAVGGGGSGSGANGRASASDTVADRREKLGQALTYMWTSKLYCDVRIHLETPEGEDYSSDTSDGSDDSLRTTVIFTAHRFMLASRSPYFATLLLNPNEFSPATADVHLPTPPFTPAALHFCLGWIYAGRLDFSNRSFDLLTAFQIYRAANYLQLTALADELESRLVHDFCHGLEWSKCHCRKCIGRVSRIWRFAAGGDVGALELNRRARRFILNGWATCWGREIGLADKSERDDLMTDVVNSLGPTNVVSAFRGIERVRSRMEDVMRTPKGREAAVWVDALAVMVDAVETRAREVLSTQLASVCQSQELWDVLAGTGFSDDLLDVVLREIVALSARVPGYVQGPKVYEIIVGSILLRTDVEGTEPLLSHMGRRKVDHAKEAILENIKRRWMQIHEEGGFTVLEKWSLAEIADEVNVSVDDLLSARQVPFPRVRDNGFPRTSSRATGLSDAGTSTRTRTTSDSSRTSTIRSAAVQTPENIEPNGLRTLRLSSSASTSSAVSVRTAASASRTASAQRRAPPASGPQPRSPTAAHKTFVVSVGAKGRTTPGGQSAQSPTPARAGQVMTGPPRPLLTGIKASGSKAAASRAVGESSVTSPSPSPASRPGSRAQRPASPTRGLRHQISLASVSSVATSRTSASTATVRSNSSARTATGATRMTATAAGKAPVTTARSGSTSPNKPAQSTAAARMAAATRAAAYAAKHGTVNGTAATAKPAARTTATATAAGAKAAAATTTTTGAKSTTATAASSSTARSRTGSGASTATTTKGGLAPRTRTMSASSTKSRPPSITPGSAPAVPPIPKSATAAGAAKTPTVTPSASRTSLASKASVAAARATSKTPDPRASSNTPDPRGPAKATPTLRPAASTKSLRSTASTKSATTAGAPKTPANPKVPTAVKTPSTPSDTLQTPSTGGTTRVRSTSLNPKATSPSLARQRTASTSSAPWKRATPVPPTVAGVRPRPSIRSSSGSTEGPPEAITPRLSVTEPVIVLHSSSAPNSPVLAASPDGKSPTLDDVPPVPALPPMASVVDVTVSSEVKAEDEETEVVPPVAVVISPDEDENAPSPPPLPQVATMAKPLMVQITPPTAVVEPVVTPVPPKAKVMVEAPKAVAPPVAEPELPKVVAHTALPAKVTQAAPAPTPVPPKVAKPAPGPLVIPLAFAEARAPAPPLAETIVDSPPPKPVAKSPPLSPVRTAAVASNPPPTPPKNPMRAAVTTSPTTVTVTLPPRVASPTPPTPAPKLTHSVQQQPLPQSRSPRLRTVSTASIKSAPMTVSPRSRTMSTASSATTAIDGSPRSVFSKGGPLMPPLSRQVSDVGSERTVRYHPAHAFDPPPRKASLPIAPPPAPPKIEEIDDANVPYKGHGVTLHVGIPCLVNLPTRRRGCRANVKYLGTMAGARGPWVGLEVEELDGVDTLPTGAKAGVRYFHFTPSPPEPTADDDKAVLRQRRIAAIADSLQGTARNGRRAGNGLGLGLAGVNGAMLGPPADARRVASPYAANWTALEKPRALFVRPSEVIFVMGAD